MKVILDKKGESYQITVSDDDLGPSFHLKFQDPKIQHSYIGFANFLWDCETTLLLADIRLNDKGIVIYPSTGWFRWLKRARREEKNFQRNGIGTQLLYYALETVKGMGVKRVIGKIKRHDFEKNPNLPKWYADLGFTVTMENGNSTVVAQISKDL